VAGCDIQGLDKCAFANLALNEFRLPPHPIVCEHHLLAHIQEAPGGVKTDKSQATGDQNHDGVSSTGIFDFFAGFFVVRSESHTTVDKSQITRLLNCASPQPSLKS